MDYIKSTSEENKNYHDYMHNKLCYSNLMQVT
jgi:hypothetical protein